MEQKKELNEGRVENEKVILIKLYKESMMISKQLSRASYMKKSRTWNST